MTILQALDGFYDRMAARGEAEPPGWSRERFGLCVVIDGNGKPVDLIDLREAGTKKPLPRLYSVPAAVKRTISILPNFLWDKTAYALGRTAGTSTRATQEHAAFVAFHLNRLGDATDEGLVALCRFLVRWRPAHFDRLPFDADMLDSNVMFRLRGDDGFLHERPAAQSLVDAAEAKDDDSAVVRCLVTGAPGPLARLHPTIKGINGSQSSGAALVSFNLGAFTSYGKEQGANAPTCKAAAFRYGAALNRLLLRGGRNRLALPIGDATTVFWADGSDTSSDAADALDRWFAEALTTGSEGPAMARFNREFEAVAAGKPLATIHPGLRDDIRFNVLGLSPNSARLSVRFWISDEFRVLVRRIVEHRADLRIEPMPWEQPPLLNLLLARTVAEQGKFEHVPPMLAGDVVRAILYGARYPRSLLSAVISRLRAGDTSFSGWHAALIHAILVRDFRCGILKEDVPTALQRDSSNQAYQLGRLFAMLEVAQRIVRRSTSTTIRHQHFAAAAARPAAVFPRLRRNAAFNLSKLDKMPRNQWVTAEIDEIVDKLTPELPLALPLVEQGRFVLGYYHQRRSRFTDQAIAAEMHESAVGEESE